MFATHNKALTLHHLFLWRNSLWTQIKFKIAILTGDLYALMHQGFPLSLMTAQDSWWRLHLTHYTATGCAHTHVLELYNVDEAMWKWVTIITFNKMPQFHISLNVVNVEPIFCRNVLYMATTVKEQHKLFTFKTKSWKKFMSHYSCFLNSTQYHLWGMNVYVTLLFSCEWAECFCGSNNWYAFDGKTVSWWCHLTFRSDILKCSA